jgi:hypothetical protein
MAKKFPKIERYIKQVNLNASKLSPSDPTSQELSFDIYIY